MLLMAALCAYVAAGLWFCMFFGCLQYIIGGRTLVVVDCFGNMYINNLV